MNISLKIQFYTSIKKNLTKYQSINNFNSKIRRKSEKPLYMDAKCVKFHNKNEQISL